METTVAAPVAPQAPDLQPKPNPKKHHRRTFNNSNFNPQGPPRYYPLRRQARNNHYNENTPKSNSSDGSILSEQNINDNNSPGHSSEGSDQSPTHMDPGGRPRRFSDQSYLAKKKKVMVMGYPTYTNSMEIVKLLSQFGQVQVEKCNKVVTVLNYQTEQEAQAAVDANGQIVLYGKFLKVIRYTNKKHVQDMSKATKRMKPPQVEDQIIHPKEIELSGDFYEQMENVQAAIRLTVEEIKVISSLYKDVEAILQPCYPGCKAIPFGSITTGLGIKSSDADCFVEMPAAVMGPGLDVQFVGVARRLLAARPDLFTDVVAIPGANTPIVKFRHVPTGTRCDLNCKTPLGTLNSRLVGALLAHDARLQPAALALKYWARTHQLSGSGRLTNYALVLLLVFYLQARRVLPPVASLQHAACTVRVDHWDAGFAPGLLRPPTDDVPLPHLLGGFFEFYAQFPFDLQVVCPFLGRAVPKEAFERDGAPAGLERYAGNVARRLVAPLRHASPMVVQDPIEQSHNVTTGVSRNLAAEFRSHVAFAAEQYRAALPTCRALLPGLLLAGPERLAKRPGPVRVRVAPRSMRAVVGDWRNTLRTLLIDEVFGRMLALTLEPAPPREDESPADCSRYGCSAARVTWTSRRLAEPTRTAASALAEREAAVGARLAQAGAELPEPLALDLALFWSEVPRSLALLVYYKSGDIGAFKVLASFLQTTLHNWVHVLLRPHLIAPPQPAPAPAPASTPLAPMAELRLEDAPEAPAAPAFPPPSD